MASWAGSYGYDGIAVQKQKENLLDLIQSNGGSMPLTSIHATYGSTYGGCLTVKKYGYDSLQDFIETMSDDFSIEEGQVFVRMGTVVQKQKENVLELIQSNGGCMPLKSIHGAYGSTYGVNLAVKKYGFGSVEDFIETMSDDLNINDGQVFDNGKAVRKQKENVLELIQSNGGCMPLKSIHGAYGSTYGVNFAVKKYGFGSVEDFIETMSDDLNINDGQVFDNGKAVRKQKENVLELIQSNGGCMPLKSIHGAYGSTYGVNFAVKKYGFGSVEDFIDTMSDDLNINDGQVFDNGKVVQKQKENLLDLIQSNGGSMPFESIHAAYGSTYGGSLTVRKYGYDSVQDFIEKMSDDFWIDEGQVFDKAGLIKQKKRKLFAMVQHHPNGISLHLLSSKFWEMYKEELGIKTLGFSSVRNFIENMDNELCISEKGSQLVITRWQQLLERRMKETVTNVKNIAPARRAPATTTKREEREGRELCGVTGRIEVNKTAENRERRKAEPEPASEHGGTVEASTYSAYRVQTQPNDVKNHMIPADAVPSTYKTAAVPSMHKTSAGLTGTDAVPRTYKTAAGFGDAAAVPSMHKTAAGLAGADAVPTTYKTADGFGDVAAVPSMHKTVAGLGEAAAVPSMHKTAPGLAGADAVPSMHKTAAGLAGANAVPSMHKTAAGLAGADAVPSMHKTAAGLAGADAVPSMHKTAAGLAGVDAVPSTHNNVAGLGEADAVPSMHKTVAGLAEADAVPSTYKTAAGLGEAAALPSMHKTAAGLAGADAVPFTHNNVAGLGEADAVPSMHKTVAGLAEADAVPSMHKTAAGLGEAAAAPSMHNTAAGLAGADAVPTTYKTDAGFGDAAAVPSMHKTVAGLTGADAVPTTYKTADGFGDAAAVPSMHKTVAGLAGADAVPSMHKTAAGLAGANAVPSMHKSAAGLAGADAVPSMHKTAAGLAGADAVPSMHKTAAGLAGADAVPSMHKTAAGLGEATAVPSMHKTAAGLAGADAVPSMHKTAAGLAGADAVPSMHKTAAGLGEATAVPSMHKTAAGLAGADAVPSTHNNVAGLGEADSVPSTYKTAAGLGEAAAVPSMHKTAAGFAEADAVPSTYKTAAGLAEADAVPSTYKTDAGLAEADPILNTVAGFEEAYAMPPMHKTIAGLVEADAVISFHKTVAGLAEADTLPKIATGFGEADIMPPMHKTVAGLVDADAVTTTFKTAAGLGEADAVPSMNKTASGWHIRRKEVEITEEWTEVFSKLPFLKDYKTEVDFINAVVSSTHDINDTEDWGKRFVWAYLQRWQESGPEPQPLKVIWLNDTREGDQPFDFSVTFQTSKNSTDTHTLYINVKSTSDSEMIQCRMSPRELDFAQNNGENYQMYCVYNAGDVNRACIYCLTVSSCL